MTKTQEARITSTALCVYRETLEVKFIERKAAIEEFTAAYFNTGCEWDDAEDMAKTMFKRFSVEHGHSYAVDRLRLEACNYAGM